jgi:cell cycle arrest protein BUB2
MPSPSRETIPSFQPHLQTDLQPPPSPRTHRALRRLQSAHTLGARAAIQPTSLISQQRREQQQQLLLLRNTSPTRSSDAQGQGSSQTQLQYQRGRANSDANSPLVHQMNAVTAAKRAGSKKPVFSHGHLSLQQIIRDGPPDTDFQGALESARWKVIDEGVKSAEDGMVSFLVVIFPTWL